MKNPRKIELEIHFWHKESFFHRSKYFSRKSVRHFHIWDCLLFDVFVLKRFLSFYCTTRLGLWTNNVDKKKAGIQKINIVIDILNKKLSEFDTMQCADVIDVANCIDLYQLQYFKSKNRYFIKIHFFKLSYAYCCISP